MRRLGLPLALGLAHGISDGAAGYLLGTLAHTPGDTEIGLLVLLCNLLAFGAQPVIGLLTDRLRQPRAMTLLSLLLMGVALCLSPVQPRLAVALAGLASAAFHVSGGALALCAPRGQAAGPGFFAAPGVLGLALGGLLAAGRVDALWIGLGLLVLCGASLAGQLPRYPATANGLALGLAVAAGGMPLLLGWGDIHGTQTLQQFPVRCRFVAAISNLHSLRSNPCPTAPSSTNSSSASTPAAGASVSRSTNH